MQYQISLFLMFSCSVEIFGFNEFEERDKITVYSIDYRQQRIDAMAEPLKRVRPNFISTISVVFSTEGWY